MIDDYQRAMEKLSHLFERLPVGVLRRECEVAAMRGAVLLANLRDAPRYRRIEPPKLRLVWDRDAQ